MYQEEHEAEIVAILKEMLVETIPLAHGRELRIPYDCKVGWNKGDFDYDHPEKNPDGLKDYVGEDKRTRRPEVSILDRILHRKYG
jgi:hypothetical protein